MIKIKHLLVFFILILTSTATFAELYKWVDKEGNISYSDQPPVKGAKQFDAPKLSSVPATKIPQKKPEIFSKEAPSTRYTSLAIISPKNDATIRNNEGKVSISFKATPPLNTEQGHYFTLMLDDKIKKKNFSGGSTSLSYIDRGSHTIGLIIKDKNNKTLYKSKTITFHLFRNSILN